MSHVSLYVTAGRTHKRLLAASMVIALRKEEATMNDYDDISRGLKHTMTDTMTDVVSGELRGSQITVATKTVGDLTGYWHDTEALANSNPATPLYTTESWFPDGEQTEGALAWGNTRLLPGKIGREYFMTRGHWHRRRETGELVICVAGEGALVLMNEKRETRIELLRPGSTHYVPGYTAHRTVNTGSAALVFLCAWTANCEHEYASIREHGFSRLLMEVDGVPQLVARQSH